MCVEKVRFYRVLTRALNQSKFDIGILLKKRESWSKMQLSILQSEHADLEKSVALDAVDAKLELIHSELRREFEHRRALLRQLRNPEV